MVSAVCVWKYILTYLCVYINTHIYNSSNYKETGHKVKRECGLYNRFSARGKKGWVEIK